MGKKPEFLWDETTGVCSCQIVIDDFLYGFGMAECAPEDKDMISERTGARIAEIRAQINLLQNYKNRELYPKLKGLKHLKATMVNSSRFNPDSYEAKRLDKEIKNIELEISDIYDAILYSKQHLYNYINDKEKLYQRIRSKSIKPYKEEDTERIDHMIDFYDKVLKDDSKT